jgi:hypothetical protein
MESPGVISLAADQDHRGSWAAALSRAERWGRSCRVPARPLAANDSAKHQCHRDTDRDASRYGGWPLLRLTYRSDARPA